MTPAAEAAATAVAGAALAGAAGALVGAAVPAAVVGGLNGAISGHRGIYDWRSVKGASAFALDSTWALGTTTAGLVAHAVAAVRGDAQYSGALSRRANRHVYGRGMAIRRGFATTFGNVVNGAGDLARARRVKLVTDHEDVHIWQARAFGPLYPTLYLGWMVVGGAGGAALWALRRRDERFGRVVESVAYYLNPFEYWAYSRDDHWPPKQMVRALGPTRPMVRSFASFR
ncbi:MAG: hypothetical protein HKN44_02600 [Ilumatobacter sp.]|nr:hypothetical protein [Ilumatobacter sp.]